MFKEKPPQDVWPSPDERFKNSARYKRINTNEYFIVWKTNISNKLYFFLTLWIVLLLSSVVFMFAYTGHPIMAVILALLLLGVSRSFSPERKLKKTGSSSTQRQKLSGYLATLCLSTVVGLLHYLLLNYNSLVVVIFIVLTLIMTVTMIVKSIKLSSEQSSIKNSVREGGAIGILSVIANCIFWICIGLLLYYIACQSKVFFIFAVLFGLIVVVNVVMGAGNGSGSNSGGSNSGDGGNDSGGGGC